jgi:hypothetical protein
MKSQEFEGCRTVCRSAQDRSGRSRTMPDRTATQEWPGCRHGDDRFATKARKSERHARARCACMNPDEPNVGMKRTVVPRRQLSFRGTAGTGVDLPLVLHSCALRVRGPRCFVIALVMVRPAVTICVLPGGQNQDDRPDGAVTRASTNVWPRWKTCREAASCRSRIINQSGGSL